MLVLITFISGLAFLLMGAELLVRGASRIAVAAGISPLVVGLTIVSFGTSSPELAISVQAAWSGQTDLALANAVGSNIFNILVILGVSALIAPLIVHKQIVRQEIPVMIGLTVLLIGLAWDLSLSRLDGAILSILMLAYIIFLVCQARLQATSDSPQDPQPPAQFSKQRNHFLTSAAPFAMIVVGLALLVFGADWLVKAAVIVAKSFGVSEVVIGLTVVAAGTSLPELATSAMAAVRGERDIAVGNVVGSNIFNIACVLGVSALVAPQGLSVAVSMMSFDLWFMLGVSLVCLPIVFTGYVVSRLEGTVLICTYVLYTAYLIASATNFIDRATF